MHVELEERAQRGPTGLKVGEAGGFGRRIGPLAFLLSRGSWEGRAVDRPRDPGTARATLDKRQQDVAAMFDRVAARYDIANDILSLGQDRAWRRLVHEAVAPQSGETILDVAAGTGTSTAPFVEAGAFVVATDLSLGMLTVGRQRQPQLTFVAGDALQLPFRDASFDAVTITFGLRNVEDTSAALTEMARADQAGRTAGDL